MDRFANQRNSMIMAVMLSQPTSSEVSFANNESNKFYSIVYVLWPVFRSFPILVTIGWLSVTYL